MTGSGAICMAVYRPERASLKRQIDSIAAQTVRDWVCEIAIDGAREEDQRLVEDCVQGDERFHVRSYANRAGFYRNFERALAQVTSGVDWVALADQDDDWYPTKLERLLPRLRNATLVTGQARVVNAAGSTLGHHNTRRRWNGLFSDMLDNSITGSFCVFRGSLLSLALPFPTPTDAAYHDHWIGVCAAGVGSVEIIDEPLQDYIQHDHNVVGETRGGRWGARVRSWVAAGHGRPSLRYLASHRWGWRVLMARALLSRIQPTPAVAGVLAVFARGTLSRRLILWVVRAVARGAAPAARSFALLAGSAYETYHNRK